MTPNVVGGLKIPRLRLPQDIRSVAPPATALLLVIAAGAIMSSALPAGTELWMRVSAWAAPVSFAFAAWWWKTQRD